MVQYNVDRYLELLKLEQKLKKENKLLRNEDPSKYLELLDYSVQMIGYGHWCQRNEYLQLINDFVNFLIISFLYRLFK